MRAIGPELAIWRSNPLADPTLELHDSTGALIASNDNWQHTIIGGSSLVTRSLFARAAMLRATQGSRRLSQTCHPVTTPRSCVA